MRKILVLFTTLFVCLFAFTAVADGVFAFEVSEYDVLLNKSIKLNPIAQDIEGKLSYIWSSSDNNIATVKSGTVKGISVGDVTITCIATTKNGDSYETSCIVHVLQPVKSISVEEKNVTMSLGQTYSPVVSIEPSEASNQTIVWKSSKPDVASVDAVGNVRAVSVGSATITGTASDGSKVTVKYKVTVPKVYVTDESITITTPDAFRFGYALNANGFSTVTYNENGTFIVESSKTSSDGITWLSIVPVKAGSGSLKLRSGGTTKTIKITVKHSAVYDDISYPPVAINKLIDNPDKYLDSQTNITGVCCSIEPVDKNKDYSPYSIVYAMAGDDVKEYFAFVCITRLAPEISSQVKVYGVVSEYVEYISDTGLKYTCPLLDSKKIETVD